MAGSVDVTGVQHYIYGIGQPQYAPTSPQAPGTGGSTTPAAPTQVATSRDLNSADSGQILECTATVTLNVPTGLPAGFRCVVIPSGTTSVSFTGTTGNGASATISRAAASNTDFGIIQRGSSATSYVVDGV